MMGWLRTKLREWLKEPDAPVNELDCVVGGKQRRMRVIESFGLKLAVRDESGEYLVGSNQCVDPMMFWKAWGQRKPPGLYVWPDGSPFEPGG
jgi:hypothetical protein